MKIGRNDPRPCGSGEKYKNYCLDNNEKIENTPHTAHSEAEVVEDLLDESPHFKAVYEAERKKIVTPIIWAHNRGLPLGINFMVQRLHGHALIWIKKFPIAVLDAKGVAHELLHLVLDKEGFPSLRCKPGFMVRTSRALSSLPLDLVIDERLRAVGFDIDESYQREIGATYRQINGFSVAPLHKSGESYWVVNYADSIICWNSFCASNEKTNEFKQWFDDKHPEIAARGQELLAIIDETGYETPEQTKLFYERAISFLGIERDVDLHYEI